jgi:hypothetical protein
MIDNWAPSGHQSQSYRLTGDDHAWHDQAKVEQHYAQAANRARHFPRRAKIMRMDSVDAAAQMADASLDLVFLDADHSYQGVREDLVAWVPKVKPGGWIGGHDYENPEPKFDFSGVERAVNEWANGRPVEKDLHFTWFTRFGADRVLIVASGPSVEAVGRSLPKLQGVHVIAVNEAIKWLPHADSFFTMDPDRRMRPLLSRPRAGVRYYLAYEEKLNFKNVTHLQRIMSVGVRGSCFGLMEQPDQISAGNSAYGALNLAYHMRPKRIAFLGLDGTDKGHAYSGTNPGWSLKHLPELFDSTLPQLTAANIQVVNGSPGSKIESFPRMSPQEALKWIAE